MSENPLSSDTVTGTETPADAIPGHAPSPASSAGIPDDGEQRHPPQPACREVPLERFRWVIKRLEIVFLMLLLLAVVLGIFVPMSVYFYRHFLTDEPKPKVVSVQSAGRVVSVTQSGGWFARALVETDTGFYALVDAISLNKGEALTLEDKGPKRQFLCDSQHHCQKLVPFLDREQGQ
jgi:hypothetical protein